MNNSFHGTVKAVLYRCVKEGPLLLANCLFLRASKTGAQDSSIPTTMRSHETVTRIAVIIKFQCQLAYITTKPPVRGATLAPAKAQNAYATEYLLRLLAEANFMWRRKTPLADWCMRCLVQYALLTHIRYRSRLINDGRGSAETGFRIVEDEPGDAVISSDTPCVSGEALPKRRKITRAA